MQFSGNGITNSLCVIYGQKESRKIHSRLFFSGMMPLCRLTFLSLFSVKQTFIKEQTITSDFKGHKLDLTQRDPADTTLEDCIEEHTDELCLTEDCVKAGTVEI